MSFSFAMLAPFCFFLGVLLLRLVLQLVCQWSSPTMLVVCFFPIFNELFPHFLNFFLLCFFAFVALWCWILFFFAWCIVVALGVATMHWWSFLTMLIVYFFTIVGEVFPHFLDYVLLHVFCCVMMSTFFLPLIGTLFLHWCCDFYIGDHRHQ
jgi:hypothetical protein